MHSRWHKFTFAYVNVNSDFCRHLYGMNREESSKGLTVVCLLEEAADLEMRAFFLQNKSRLTVLTGTPCNRKHLERARIREAEAIFVIADLYSANPSDQDAASIMRIIAIKDYWPQVLY